MDCRVNITVLILKNSITYNEEREQKRRMKNPLA